MKAVQAWQAALGQLQMEMPKAAFDTWVRDAQLVSYEDGSFIIGVQNAYARDWLESRLSSTITRLLTGIMNRTVDVRFTVWQNVDENTTHVQVDEPETISNLDNPSLNRRYSFT
ncbi:MAG TPA: chromosomal replication initiator protein DnaA, partial [Chloroflexi bacterium]|nr:chromosomal replication initiator protein DnaA [Chloroflexota bacterium]